MTSTPSTGRSPEAIRFGRHGEARELLAKGTALLNGTGWSDLDDFLNSIVLRSDRLIADPIRPLALRVEQIYGSTLTLSESLSARVSLHRIAVAPGQAPGLQHADWRCPARLRRVRRAGSRLARVAVPPRFRSPPGVPDGSHVIVASLATEGRMLATRGLVVEVRKNLDTRVQKLEAAARARGDLVDGVRADLLYPVDHIRLVNRGVVEPGGFDVDARWQTLKPQWRLLQAAAIPSRACTGFFKRHYLMAESGEIMPYALRADVLQRKEGLPPGGGAARVGCERGVVLRGRPAAAVAGERRGLAVLVAAPLGYRLTGGYGRTSPNASQDPAAVKRRALSEADVLNVIESFRKTYKVDDNRIYLLGHSMGAAGAWHLGAKFPDRWAALACVAGSSSPASEEKMRGAPAVRRPRRCRRGRARRPVEGDGRGDEAPRDRAPLRRGARRRSQQHRRALHRRGVRVLRQAPSAEVGAGLPPARGFGGPP